MKVYNLIVTNGEWSTCQIFGSQDKAVAHAESLEDGQRNIEGNSLKSLFHYSESDLVYPPVHAYGRRVYCSYAWTEIEKPFTHKGCTWRIIYEQDVK